MVWTSAVRRHWVSAAGAVLVVSMGATAYACANLATVSPSTTVGPPAAVITLTGASFASLQSAPDAAPTVPPVVGAPAVPGAGPAAADGPQAASGELDPSIWFSLIASLAAVALMLLGSGLVAFLYQVRQSKLPADALWVPPGW